MGTLVTLKKDVFKKGNRISANLEALGPLSLKETRVITSIQLDYLQ